jgi:hypothetical protein
MQHLNVLTAVLNKKQGVLESQRYKGEKSHNGSINKLYILMNNISINIARRIRWAENVARTALPL